MLQKENIYQDHRELTVAVKEWSSRNNSRLKDAIAKANNMPNIHRKNIKKVAGEDSAVNYENMTYEGYGPNGTAIIVDTLTDKKQNCLKC